MGTTATILNKIWKPLAVSAAVCFLYATVLIKLGTDWWTDENYSHGLLVPFVIGYIVWLEFEDLKSAAERPQFLLGGGIVLLAILTLLGGTLGAELFMQRISLALMIAGVIIYFWGKQVVTKLVLPFILLLFAIPIPQIIFNKIAFPLQLWASQIAVWGIRFFEVASVRKGNVIEILPLGSLQTVSMEVVEACSGIRSLMTLVTLALILAYFTSEKRQRISDGLFSFTRNFDFWRAIILMTAAIPIAIITNAGRVTATGILAYYYGKQATTGFIHSSSGWMVYVAALILLILINFCLVYAKKLLIRNKQNN